jgi:hypothetical protein
VGLAADTQAAGAGSSDLQAEIATLSSRVLADPMDSTSATKLKTLRQQRQQQQNHDLDRLAQGLEHGLGGRFGLAAQALKRVMDSRFAVALADRQLPLPLADVLERCKSRIGPQVCPICGDTGWADCRSPGCAGSGLKVCRDCQGKGRGGARRSARSSGPCETCERSGSLDCTVCAGRGVVPCPRCARGSGQEKPALTPEETDAVRRLIDLAGYLLDGGIDLYSPDALAKSPRLQLE